MPGRDLRIWLRLAQHEEAHSQGLAYQAASVPHLKDDGRKRLYGALDKEVEDFEKWLYAEDEEAQRAIQKAKEAKWRRNRYEFFGAMHRLKKRKDE